MSDPRDDLAGESELGAALRASAKRHQHQQAQHRDDLAALILSADDYLTSAQVTLISDTVIGAGWTPPDHDAFGMAMAAAAKLGAALAEFQNALDALARATPHCDECGWASSRGHRKSCRSQATIDPPV